MLSAYLPLFLHSDIAANVRAADFLGYRDLNVGKEVFKCRIVRTHPASKLEVTYWIEEKTKLVLREIQTPDHITTITWFRVNPELPNSLFVLKPPPGVPEAENCPSAGG